MSQRTLRAQPALLEDARKVAEVDGATLNHFININVNINVAIAEKVPALRAERSVRERAVRCDLPKALAILDRAGGGPRSRKNHRLCGARHVRCALRTRPEERETFAPDLAGDGATAVPLDELHIRVREKPFHIDGRRRRAGESKPIAFVAAIEIA